MLYINNFARKTICIFNIYFVSKPISVYQSVYFYIICDIYLCYIFINLMRAMPADRASKLNLFSVVDFGGAQRMYDFYLKYNGKSLKSYIVVYEWIWIYICMYNLRLMRLYICWFLNKYFTFIWNSIWRYTRNVVILPLILLNEILPLFKI